MHGTTNRRARRPMIEKVKQRELVFQGHFLRVYRDSVELPNGKSGVREFIDHSGASVILAQNTEGQYLLLKQYRHSLQTEFFEFPAGRRDGNEDFLETAQRELLEETGYRAAHWSYLGPLHPCIGYGNEVIHIYFAKALEFSECKREEGEHIEMFWKSQAEIETLIQQQQLTDAKSLSVWLIYQLSLRTPPG